jgi:hypothetical protein
MKVYIEFLNKDNDFKKEVKTFDTLEDAVKWGRLTLESFTMDMIKFLPITN